MIRKVKTGIFDQPDTAVTGTPIATGTLLASAPTL